MPPTPRSGSRRSHPTRKVRTAGARRSVSRDCKACGGPFRSRSRAHVYCARKRCRRARRLEYMRRYMAEWKRSHPGYWKTEKQKRYLKRWREAHPDYFRKYMARRRKKDGGAAGGSGGRRGAKG